MPRSTLWTAENIALLGTMNDVMLAARLGCDVKTVFKRRKKMGIAACPGHSDSLWADPANVALLGTMSDGEVAKIVGCTTVAVCIERNRRGIYPFLRQGWPSTERRRQAKK